MANNIAKATHEGILKIGDYELTAYNLDNGERVLSRIGFIKALGRTGKAKGGRKYDDEFKVPVFISANNLKPFISSELLENSSPMHFIDLNGNESIGYKAQLLPSVCYVFMDAAEDGKLLKNQHHILERSKQLVRGFATVGIIALIDEATGYQYDREAQELQKILKAYISQDLIVWQKRFPDIFYKEIFRLNGWNYTVSGIKKRPGVIGTWTNNLIYKRLPKGVLDELKSRTPKDKKGNRKHRFHQLLTLDIGNPDLQRQLTSVITIMQLSKNWKDFEKKFNQLYGQTSLDLQVEEVVENKEMSDFNKKLKKGLEWNPKDHKK